MSVLEVCFTDSTFEIFDRPSQNEEKLRYAVEMMARSLSIIKKARDAKL